MTTKKQRTTIIYPRENIKKGKSPEIILKLFLFFYFSVRTLTLTLEAHVMILARKVLEVRELITYQDCRHIFHM